MRMCLYDIQNYPCPLFIFVHAWSRLTKWSWNISIDHSVSLCVENWPGRRPDVQRFDKAHLWSFFPLSKCPSCSISKYKDTNSASNQNTVERVGQEKRERKKEREQEKSQMGMSEKDRYQDLIMLSAVPDIVLVKYWVWFLNLIRERCTHKHTQAYMHTKTIFHCQPCLKKCRWLCGWMMNV